MIKISNNNEEMFSNTIKYKDFVKTINSVLYTSIPAKKARAIKLKEGDAIEIIVKKIGGN